MKLRFPKARSRSQRTFFVWLDEAAPRFMIPIIIQRRTRHEVEFSFTGIPAVLHGRLSFDRISASSSENRQCARPQKLSGGEIEIFVDWHGENWDILLELDAYPVRTARGYICDECPPGNRNVFQSREALWRDHLFEPLLEWINEELASAHALGIYKAREGGSTWAKLLGNGDDPEAYHLVARVMFAES